MGPEVKDLKTIMRHPGSWDRALARLALAYHAGRGVRLTWKEIIEIYELDDALHTRLNEELNRLDKLNPRPQREGVTNDPRRQSALAIVMLRRVHQAQIQGSSAVHMAGL